MEAINFILGIAIIIGLFVAVSRLGDIRDYQKYIASKLGNVKDHLNNIEGYWKYYTSTGYGGGIDYVQFKNRLSETTKCSECGLDITLSFGEQIYRVFKCPHCDNQNDYN